MSEKGEDLTCIVRNVSFVRRTKYSRKLYELNDCDVRSMLWYKLKMACRLGVPTDISQVNVQFVAIISKDGHSALEPEW